MNKLKLKSWQDDIPGLGWQDLVLSVIQGDKKPEFNAHV